MFQIGTFMVPQIGGEARIFYLVTPDFLVVCNIY